MVSSYFESSGAPRVALERAREREIDRETERQTDRERERAGMRQASLASYTPFK